MVNQPAADSTTRTIRVPAAVWREARTVATKAGESVAAVLNRALLDYIAHPPELPASAVVECAVCGRVVKRKGGGGVSPAGHNNPDGERCVS